MSQQNPATLLYVIKQLELAVSNAVDLVVAEAGLTSTQYTALTVLDRHPGMTAAALARNSFVRAQTAASLVNALENLGMIERQPDPSSRRQNLIFLTDTGRTVLSNLDKGISLIQQRATAQLSDDETQALYALLQKSRSGLTER